MANKNVIFVIVLALLILVTLANAVEWEEGGPPSDEEPSAYDPANEYDSANPYPFYANPNSDLSQIPYGDLDPALVAQYERWDDLSSEQLMYGQTPLIEQADLDSLNPQARDSALTELNRRAGNPEDISTSTGGRPSKVTSYSDGIEFDSIASLRVGNIFVTNGNKVSYRSGKIFIDDAESVILGTNILTNIIDLEGDVHEFRIDKAGMVNAICVNAENVKKTVFKVDGGVKLEPYDSISYPVQISATDTHFTSGAEGSMNVKCTTPPSLAIERSVMNITRGDITERIEANFSVNFTLSSFGVECMDMNPLATYYYIYKNSIEKDFSARAAVNPYHLCIKKDASQRINNISCPQCGIIDLVAKKMMFNGIIYYRRYLFRTANNNYALLGLDQENIYFPQNNASASFSCDDDNRFLSAEMIRSNHPPISSFISTFLSLFEMNTGQRTHRMVDVNEQLESDEMSQNLIEGYSTTYDTTDTRITNNMLEHGNITILPVGHPRIRQIAQEIWSLQPVYLR